MVTTLRGMGRDIADIDAWLTSWDYFALAGMLARSVFEKRVKTFLSRGPAAMSLS